MFGAIDICTGHDSEMLRSLAALKDLAFGQKITIIMIGRKVNVDVMFLFIFWTTFPVLGSIQRVPRTSNKANEGDMPWWFLVRVYESHITSVLPKRSVLLAIKLFHHDEKKKDYVSGVAQ
ncbi:jg25920 [Pararge aegeria aegeria]|uniref:Jg25920 protein n=1 Tax=Pararge aegeria aegeria TaxID=348720 RepID=A0A8S4QKG2_9NEOP|nr:jg25920 [Pararge aegeria aegeria]